MIYCCVPYLNGNPRSLPNHAKAARSGRCAIKHIATYLHVEGPLSKVPNVASGHLATCHFANCYGQPEKSAHFQIESVPHSADLSANLSEGGRPEELLRKT